MHLFSELGEGFVPTWGPQRLRPLPLVHALLNTGLEKPGCTVQVGTRALLPDSVRWGWRDIHSQGPRQLLDLHRQQQRRVGHLLDLLFDELVLSGFLEVLGLGDLVHEAQDLAAGAVAPDVAQRRGRVGRQPAGWSRAKAVGQAETSPHVAFPAPMLGEPLH